MKITKRRIIQLIAALPFTVILIKNFEYSGVLLMLITAIGGAFYCGYLCPFGLTQELAAELSKKLKIKRRKIPEKLDKYLRALRYILFTLITVFSVSIVFKMLQFDPRSNLYMILTGKTVTITMIISISVFFVISLYYDKVFCKYFCISGARYGLLSFFRVFSIKRNKESCINCKRCDRVCDMGIKVSQCDGSVKSLNCINCFKCVKSCPKANTLSYGLIKGKKRDIKIAVGVFLLIGFAVYSSAGKEKTEIPKEESKNAAIQYFEGNGQGYKGNIKVKVGIEGNKIKSVEVVEFKDSWEWYKKTGKELAESMVREQKIQVDTISGATHSSKGIIQAVEDAVGEVLVQNDGNGTLKEDKPLEYFEGTGEGYNGDIRVKVGVEGDSIKSIEVIEFEDDWDWFSKAETSVIEEIINSQSTEVDTVSGATYSSKGIINAVKDAVGERIEKDTNQKNVVIDQVSTEYHEGVGEGYNGDIRVKVGFQGDKIESIEVTEFEDDWEWFSRAEDEVIKNIIKNQSTDVDTVSGATYSSKGIIEATKMAVNAKEKK